MYNDFMYSKIDHLNFFLLDAETAKAATIIRFQEPSLTIDDCLLIGLHKGVFLMVSIMSPIVTKVNSNGLHFYQSKQYESLARISPLNYRTQRELDEKYRFNLVTGLKTLLVFQPIGLVN